MASYLPIDSYRPLRRRTRTFLAQACAKLRVQPSGRCTFPPEISYLSALAIRHALAPPRKSFTHAERAVAFEALFGRAPPLTRTPHSSLPHIVELAAFEPASRCSEAGLF
ncbi:hypothetical protein PtA15_2A922 [Puccinia triticina]|uniref:Uncharacterized protein n=1 Tax=Puccinia triticina TaxID=208348 RepID=A0ABY7CCW6_9BASI|nr:uncharacterized protein PtA15_2A922 [Puccinia triticina]WAQ82605.1 hypothetical protein PtA15_2A922 [Puccinia triticina]WAR53467.1 hypothetical protein PtB15_2B898 [Puccinia triticina]